jgi:hypothetical protein
LLVIAQRASVLECGGPPPLFTAPEIRTQFQFNFAPFVHPKLPLAGAGARPPTGTLPGSAPVPVAVFAVAPASSRRDNWKLARHEVSGSCPKMKSVLKQRKSSVLQDGQIYRTRYQPLRSWLISGVAPRLRRLRTLRAKQVQPPFATFFQPKAPEGWRTPRRFAHSVVIGPRASVLECGGPPPLFHRAPNPHAISNTLCPLRPPGTRRGRARHSVRAVVANQIAPVGNGGGQRTDRPTNPSAVRRGIFVEPESKPSPGLRPPSPSRWARDISPVGAASSVRTPDDVAPDGALSVCVWRCYKYASPMGFESVPIREIRVKNLYFMCG